MLLKNKGGFFLIELLLSLSVWLMLSLIFIPLLINLKHQAWKLEIEKQSYQILYEELQANTIYEQTNSIHSILKNGIEYQISWKDVDDSNQKEVCIRVGNTSIYSEKEICRQSE